MKDDIPMNDILIKVATSLGDFEFGIEDYSADDGKMLARKAIIHICEREHRASLSPCEKEAVSRYLLCSVRDKINNEVVWTDRLPILTSGDRISFVFGHEKVEGIVEIMPKYLNVTMVSPTLGCSGSLQLPMDSTAVFVEDMQEGTHSTEFGCQQARDLLKKMYLKHRKLLF